MTLTISATGDASPDEAWRGFAFPTQWSSWAPQIQSVEGLSSPIKPGDRGIVRGPAGAHVSVHITAVQHDQRSWSWQVRTPIGLVRMDHRVTPRGDGARASTTVHVPCAVAACYAPIAWVAMRRLVTRRRR